MGICNFGTIWNSQPQIVTLVGDVVTPVTTGVNQRTATTTFTFPTSDYTADTSHQLIVLAWIQGIEMNSHGVEYSVSLTGAPDTAQTVKLTVAVAS